MGGPGWGFVRRRVSSRRHTGLELFASSLIFFASLSQASTATCTQALSRAFGHHYQPPRIARLPLSAFPRLEFASYNVLNLDAFVGKFRTPGHGDSRPQQIKQGGQKSERHRREIADILMGNRSKFIVLQEVEGLQSALRFNRYFLDGEYHVFFTRGNDPRGIEIAMLVHRSLPFRYEYRSHAGEMWTDPISGMRKKIFSRDLPALIVRTAKDDRPLFILLGGHYKSKRDRSGDPESSVLAGAQFNRTVEIMARYRREFPGVRFVFAADRNRDPQTDREPRVLASRAYLSDTFDVVGLSPEERVTHTYHPDDSETVRSQIDAIMVSQDLIPAVEHAYVQAYLDGQNRPRPPPETFAERKRQPSDHRAIFMHLNTARLLKIHGRRKR